MTTINRIWLGSDMPEQFVQFGNEWLDLNPGYDLHDWTEEEILDNQWVNQKVIDQMHHESRQPGADKIAFYTHVADVVDYEIMMQGNCWYFNTDLKPLKPLSPITPRGGAGLAMEDDFWPVNMAMYSPYPEHGFFVRVVQALGPRYFANPGAFMNFSTGCHLLKDVYDKMPQKPVTWHRNVFNSIHWSEFGYGETPDLDREYPENAVAVHLWQHRSNQRSQRILETW